ncbi:Cell division control protein 50 [Zea mays]|uniref:Cell division control protein 50 n=1 Tax=Zea mays TaxID=4577 RepID=A0A1D6P5L2_MAIZE|nr:Cell division control protein 50 [Zea mays]AQL05234.1 Cell division control protein 50 [Zea mays]
MRPPGARPGGTPGCPNSRRKPVNVVGTQQYSKFTQQELPACKPILTPKWVVSVFLIVGVIFVPIGVVSLLAARDVVEIIDRYDEACVPVNMTENKLAYIQNETISKECIRNLTVTKYMKQPIFVYYELDNFYQNHRRYVKSRNDAQLRDASKANQTSACEPEKTTANGQPIVPCGLIAWSLFNDTYNFTRGNENLTVDKKDISWKSDREHKFGKDVYPSNFQNGALKGGATLNPKIPLSEQEDLIVWMRTAALPTFRKLYGRLYFDLKENDTITVRLNNNYNTYSFGGKKKLVLSTATWLGGKNDFLGFAYLIVGGLCIFLAFAFTLLYFVKPSPFYLCIFYCQLKVEVALRAKAVGCVGNWETTTTYPGTDARMFRNTKCPYYSKCSLYEMKCSEPEMSMGISKHGSGKNFMYIFYEGV